MRSVRSMQLTLGWVSALRYYFDDDDEFSAMQLPTDKYLNGSCSYCTTSVSIARFCLNSMANMDSTKTVRCSQPQSACHAVSCSTGAYWFHCCCCFSSCLCTVLRCWWQCSRAQWCSSRRDCLWQLVAGRLNCNSHGARLTWLSRWLKLRHNDLLLANPCQMKPANSFRWSWIFSFCYSRLKNWL